MKMNETIKMYIKETVIFLIIYTFWCLSHGISTELFYLYCQPKSLAEYIFIPFYNEIPYCRALIWVQCNSHKTSQQLLLSSVTWAMRVLTNHMMLEINAIRSKQE
jgi:hypothetical protein